jgi:hypothetical protein
LSRALIALGGLDLLAGELLAIISNHQQTALPLREPTGCQDGTCKGRKDR